MKIWWRYGFLLWENPKKVVLWVDVAFLFACVCVWVYVDCMYLSNAINFSIHCYHWLSFCIQRSSVCISFNLRKNILARCSLLFHHHVHIRQFQIHNMFIPVNLWTILDHTLGHHSYSIFKCLTFITKPNSYHFAFVTQLMRQTCYFRPYGSVRFMCATQNAP